MYIGCRCEMEQVARHADDRRTVLYAVGRREMGLEGTVIDKRKVRSDAMF